MFDRLHWVQSKRHRLWFSTKTCSCYSTKTHIKRDSHPQIEFDFVEHHKHFNVYVSQRSQIQFEAEEHAVYISFR